LLLWGARGEANRHPSQPPPSVTLQGVVLTYPGRLSLVIDTQ